MKVINRMLRKLTDDDLINWAGVRILERGRTYITRVMELSYTRDDGLVAWVRGTSRYTVLIEPVGSALRCRCTCPYRWGPCKHVVAVLLTASNKIKHKELIPVLDVNDPLHRSISSATGLDDAKLNLIKDQIKPQRHKTDAETDWQPVTKILNRRSREDLLVMLLQFARRYPQIHHQILGVYQLELADSKLLVDSIRLAMDCVLPYRLDEEVWSWKRFSPDYAYIKDRLEALLAKDCADTVVQLGRELWSGGRAIVEVAEEYAEDLDGTKAGLGACMRVILEALPSSSLEPSEQILYLIDRVLEDEASILTFATELLAPDRYTPGQWRKVATVLESRLTGMIRPGPGISTNQYKYESVVAFLSEAYSRAGMDEKVIPLLEREVEVCQNYGTLVEALLTFGRRDEARCWCIKGYQQTVHRQPGIATELLIKLRTMAAEDGHQDLVASYYALEFFSAPRLKTFTELRDALQGTEHWPAVRASLIQYLKTGLRPESQHLPDGSDPWPLPPPEVTPVALQKGPYPQFPQLELLMKIAMLEANAAEVVRYYRLLSKSAFIQPRVRQDVAQSVARTYPQIALDIWHTLVDDLIRKDSLEAFISAGEYLKAMRDTYAEQHWQIEWADLVVALRNTHRTKRQFVAILDELTRHQRR